MVSVNYTGRQVDLFIMQGAGASGMRRVSPGLGSGGGEITTGIQKAIQTFIVLFLTEKGTAVDSEYGTNFLATLRRSNTVDAQIRIAFREAAQDILDQQERYRQDDDPDDELIADLELSDISSLDPTQTQLTVLLTTVAGETRDVILPITLAIR